MTVVSIRQPGYLPYIGFFKKIESSDVFVFLDNVQYEKNDWDNRNKIKTSKGDMWLTVPIQNKFGQKINEVNIANNENWNDKHKKSIQINYSKSPFFKEFWDDVDSILSQKWEKLIDLNMKFISYFSSKLELTTKIVKSSELNVEYVSSKRLLEICMKLNADTYLSGELGKDYLNEKIFKESNINVIYEKFEHPVYKQMHGDFLPNMSIIDLLFNEGDNAKEILKNSKNF